MLKTISKELIRFAIFSIIFIGVGSTIASQTPTNNQKPTTPEGLPTDLTSSFSTGDIISADTFNNMKVHWANIVGLEHADIGQKKDKCINMKYDGESYGTGVCYGKKGIQFIKTSNGSNPDAGIADPWHTAFHATSEPVENCITLDYDGTGHGTAACYGNTKIFLIKTSNGSNADRGISDSWHVVPHNTTIKIKDCINTKRDGQGYGTGICYGEKGIQLIKTSDGGNTDNGITDLTHTAFHATSEPVENCITLGYDGTGHGTAACYGNTKIFLIKTSDGSNADNGIRDPWHIKEHESKLN